MAESLFRKIFGKGYVVASAGMVDKYVGKTVGEIVQPETIKVLKNLGVDISRHACRVFTKELISRSDYIFVMEKAQWMELTKKFPKYKGRIFLLKEFAGYRKNLDVPNPVGGYLPLSMEAYRQIKDSIERIKKKKLLQ